ncbi:MAG TPA: LysR family transcriptional regulator [Arenicellales bacterium]|nr:LysR family transcriptional regulator [Arenicellales bacterium]
MSLDWNLLRTFMVIVQEGSVTGAASRLNRKQPTISNALGRLEKQLDKHLIERRPGQFRVTSAGEQLYRECLEIYGNIARIPTLIRDIADEVRGQVRISMASHVVCPLFDVVMTEFHARHPEATFYVSIATSRDVEQQVLEKTASFGICLVDERQPRLEYKQMYREYFGFFCGPGHPLFGRTGLTMEDLRDESLVSFNTDQLSGQLRPVALLRVQQNVGRRITAISPHLEEVRRMIVNGLGIGPLPIHVVQRDVEDGKLWRLPPYDDPPAIDIYLLWNPRTTLNRAEKAFLAMLRERIDQTPASERNFLPGQSP